MRIAVLACALGFCLGGPAAAYESIAGMWITEPDRKDLVSHIEVKPCGSGYCGKVLRCFDKTGAEVHTQNVGKALFWDMKPQGDGTFSGGEAFVPLLNVVTPHVELSLNGDELRVAGRVGIIRGAQVWTRLP